MKRRQALALFAAALAAPLARPQARRKVTIGVLSPSTPERGLALNQPFYARMSELGWVEGRSVTYVRAYSAGDPRRLEQLAREIAARSPDLVFAGATPSAVAMHKATKTIPIVFGAVSDPVALGMVKSLARPAGNVTGVISSFDTFGPKRLQLLAELLPRLKRVGLLVDPADPVSGADRAPVEAAASALRIELLVEDCRGPADLARCIDEIVARGAGALLGSSSAMLFGAAGRVIELSGKARVPFAGGPSAFADAGALFGYSASLSVQFRRAAEFADRILRGEKPSDLAVEQMNVVELRINAKTARALGIHLPQSVLLRADRVIE
jgi:putative ABC transport system substrate-binding protein